jgi:cell division protein FtsB
MSSPAVQFRSRMPRIAEAAVERARLTVVPRRRVRAARVPFVTLVSLILLGGVIGLLLFNTSMQQASFAATSLEDQASTLSAREQTLRMELDVLRNPQHVAEQARRMGMVTAGSPAFLRLSDDSIVGQAGPPNPAENVRIFPPAPKLPAVLNPAPTYVQASGQASTDGSGQGSTHGQGHGRGQGPGASATPHGHRGGTNDAASHQNHLNHKNQQSHQH